MNKPQDYTVTFTWSGEYAKQCKTDCSSSGYGDMVVTVNQTGKSFRMVWEDPESGWGCAELLGSPYHEDANTTESLEIYIKSLSEILPLPLPEVEVDNGRIHPLSGGKRITMFDEDGYTRDLWLGRADILKHFGYNVVEDFTGIHGDIEAGRW